MQGGCEAQVECPISEGAGKLVRLLNMINNLVCWNNKECICCCSEPAGETAEGFEARGVCRCHGQCHQQVPLAQFCPLILLVSFGTTEKVCLVKCNI